MKLTRHVLLYFFEMFLVTTLIVWGINGVISFKVGLLEILRQYVFAYTLYQLILLTIFKIKGSLEVDALTSIKNEVDRFQVFAEFKKQIPNERLVKIRDLLIENKKTVFNNKHRTFLENLLDLVDRYNDKIITNDEFRFILKQESRELEFTTKVVNFYWMNSIFLRLLK
ncbi:hypothetical protein [Paenibacillus sp. FSL K6-2524]|uniref:hypothetical protein n=1 Tax=Paenibacillus sp. FSL K6-2524 TaxID=2954516 RepID=UPI0030F8BCCD